jgi:hypothetical protein
MRGIPLAGTLLALGVISFFIFRAAAAPRGLADWLSQEPGVRYVKLATQVVDGEPWEFYAHLRGSGRPVPCVDYNAAGSGGGHCFVAVGAAGGWAVEESLVEGKSYDAIYGTAIPEAETVAFPIRGGGSQTVPTFSIPGFPMKFWFAVIPAGRYSGPPNQVVALNEVGRILGGQHWNEGTVRKPDFGSYDGLWDRRHRPTLKQP